MCQWCSPVWMIVLEVIKIASPTAEVNQWPLYDMQGSCSVDGSGGRPARRWSALIIKKSGKQCTTSIGSITPDEPEAEKQAAAAPQPSRADSLYEEIIAIIQEPALKEHIGPESGSVSVD